MKGDPNKKESKNNDKNVISITCSRHPDTPLNDKFHCDYKKPSNNNYFSNSTQGGGYSTGGGSGSGVNTQGGSYSNGYDYAPGKHSYNITLDSIIKQTSNPQHGYLVPEKTINLRNNNLADKEIGVLVGNLQYQRLDLDVFDVSNNKIGFGGVENLFYGLRFDNTLAGRYIITMNFSNNLIGDDGAKYMSDSLAMGRFPNLKSLDVSGNQISGTGNQYFAQLAKNIQQPIKILVDTTINGLQKQGKLFLGSKEAKQDIIKDWLKIGQDNGIDVKNVTVSKDIFSKIDNSSSLTVNFLLGWAKCSVVPNDVKTFATDQIIAIASKKAGIVNTVIGVATCYFETFDESGSSQQGIQFMTDIGLVGQGEFLENIE